MATLTAENESSATQIDKTIFYGIIWPTMIFFTFECLIVEKKIN